MANMTLKQMAERLTAMVAENEKRGWSERNDMPVAVSMHRKSKSTKRDIRLSSRYYPVSWVEGGQMGGLYRGDEPQPICGSIVIQEDVLLTIGQPKPSRECR